MNQNKRQINMESILLSYQLFMSDKLGLSTNKSYTVVIIWQMNFDVKKGKWLSQKTCATDNSTVR